VFAGSGSDDEDGDLSGECLLWSSNADGKIGTGATCSSSTLVAGVHKITLTASDSLGATGSATVVITVASGKLPDTNQITSYTETDGEDSDYTINAPSYTKLDTFGNALVDGAAEWAMVRDNVTGLIWEVKTDDGSIHDKDDVYQWKTDQESGMVAQDDFIDVLNREEFGGKSDWRLPNIKELTNIVNRDEYAPGINTHFFPNTQYTQSSVYWLADTYAANKDYAWAVDFNDTNDGGVDKSWSGRVCAVRGGQSAGNLVVNGDQTVTDIVSGLMWQQFEVTDNEGEICEMNWEEALRYCETLTLAGYNDWRLPNLNELRSIVNYEKEFLEGKPSIDTSLFPLAMPVCYWSATTSAINGDSAWVVKFYDGDGGVNDGYN
jgi:hypothetical protein